MPQIFNRICLLAAKLYLATENAVTGAVLPGITDARQQCNIKLVFDYLFFHILLIVPKLLVVLYCHNTTDLLLTPFFLGFFLLCMLLLKKGVPTSIVATIAALNTLALPMLSSFFNNQDTSPRYALIWILSILFCYITTNLATTLLLGGALCAYLTLAAWIRLNDVHIFVSPGYSEDLPLVTTPLFTGLYILFMIRVLGRHYRNIMLLEQERALEKQKQHSSLLNQNLTKQFILLKGLSRSGKSVHQEGNTELVEACFIEIEKQCESAIGFLDNGWQGPAATPTGKKTRPGAV